jgi:5'-3' exonuclease
MERFLTFIKFLGEGIFNFRMSKLSSISVGYMNSEAAIRANDYVKTICWTLQYYSGGCPSWRFYYPHHKSPSIQDILNHVHAENFDQTFNADTPMRLFEQLMYIIPPVCHYLLPESFRELLTDSKSPVIEYYPREFNCSNSKAILPFIDEKVLSQAMAPRYSLLSMEDTRRDCTNGHIQIYAGRDSTKTYSIIYSLCTARGGKFVFPANSDFYGQLFYDGHMRISVDSPISEWRNIYRNLVVNAEYRLPSIPKNSFKELNITNTTPPSTSENDELLYRSSSLSFSNKKYERKSRIVQSNPNVINGNTNVYGGYLEQSDTKIGFSTNQPKEANTGVGDQFSSVQSKPISVNMISQSRNYGTAPDFITNISRSQALVEYLGLSEESHNDQCGRNTRPKAQVQNETFPTFDTGGRYFADQNQKNVTLSNQRQRRFNHYNAANYDKDYSKRRYQQTN